MPAKHYSLKTFVRTVLALRLLAVTIVVAVVFGAVAYLRGYDRIGEVVLLTAQNGIEWIRLDVQQLRERSKIDLPSAVQQVLDREKVYSRDRRHGEFTYVRFYDRGAYVLGARATPIRIDTASLARIIDSTPQRFPEANDNWLKTVEINEHPYVHVVVPVIGRNGKLAAWGEGLFRISDETVASVRAAAIETAGYVALIVLATALLLYPVIMNLTRRLARYSESLLASNLETLEVLGSAIAKRDSDTDAHNYRVTLYSLRLAEAAGLESDRIRGLIKGAFLHDVGKIGIRDNILHKPARLDADEFEIMKTHVNHGIDIVARSSWLNDAGQVVSGHHEKYDGSGYPGQLASEAIPIEARIFAIADVFDALTSRRPYKEPFSYDETMRILDEGKSQHFDPDLLEKFAAIAGDLYERYCGRDDEELRNEVRGVVSRFFVGGLDTLRY